MVKKKTKKLAARVTYLELRKKPKTRVAMPTGPRLALMRCESIPLHFYRYLYQQVGKPHHWQLRRDLKDKALRKVIHGEHCEIWILYCDGSPAGFFEINTSNFPEQSTIDYIGLMEEFQGRGLGQFLISEATFAALEKNPDCVSLQTNTLDSPKALILYQKMGFKPVAWSSEEIEPWV